MAKSPKHAPEPSGVGTKLKSERIGERLTDTQIEARLSALPGWEVIDDRSALRRTVELPTVRAALAFLTYVLEIAETMDHWPGIQLQDNTITLTLTTHTAGGLTERDFELAAKVHR